MKIVTFSTLYPSSVQPSHGIFVETRLRQFLASGQVEAKVIAPVPWFPFDHPRFGRYALHARVPRVERRHGIAVVHPRYPVVPKVGMTIAPFLLARAAAPTLARILRHYPFDAIDAHYLYPDGIAAAMLGERFGKPVVITARGTDVTLIPDYRLPRAMIRWAARKAAALISVSRSLKNDLVRFGVAAERITVLRNGVDLERFKPVDRQAARARLGFRRSTLLSVGHLIPRKGHDTVIRALALLPDTELMIVGDGPERASLRALAAHLGLAPRVCFGPPVPQEELCRYYSAADALVLASSREGWANVLLEAMACGTRVVASNIGGAPELVTAPQAGVLLRERTPEALADAVRQLLSADPDPAATRRHAEQFSWAPTTRGQIEVFRSVIAPSVADERIHAAGAG